MGRTFSKHVDDDVVDRWEVFEKGLVKRHPKGGKLVGAALDLFIQLPPEIVDDVVWNGPESALSKLLNLAKGIPPGEAEEAQPFDADDADADVDADVDAAEAADAEDRRRRKRRGRSAG